jgi:hypothetical protein
MLIARMSAKAKGSDLEAAHIAAHLRDAGVDAHAHYDLPTDTYTVSTPATPDPRAKRIIDSLLGR